MVPDSIHEEYPLFLKAQMEKRPLEMLGRQPKLHGENVQQLVDSAHWTSTNRSIWTDTHMFVVKKAFELRLVE